MMGIPVKRGERVFVGLSGGVDSAVTAALLVRAGADVVGVFIKGWYPPGMPCTWAEDRRDAMRVAARLGIPFITLDASVSYKQGVIDYLVAEYRAGRTPNPDVMCNREVKFGTFETFRKEHGGAYLATGHYARAADGVLMRAANTDKDQSYFLWAVPRAVLRTTVFPLGTYTDKEDVRALARKFRLPVAEKKDSQGICFLGAVSVEDFLRAEFGSEPGRAVDTTGRDVGVHDGVLLHTLGARIALGNALPGPWYVLEKHIQDNVLVVAHERVPLSKEVAFTLTEPNWFTEPQEHMRAQYRYHGPLVSVRYDGARVTPDEQLPEPAASGQSLVCYDNDICIGGGIIA